MSAYAQMKDLLIYRDTSYKSPTTGQERLQKVESIPFRGKIDQVNQSDVNSNDRKYNKAGYTLTSFYAGVRKGDRVMDGDKEYLVQFADKERRRGPFTYPLERMTADG